MKTALYSKADYKFYTTFCVIVINLQSISYCCSLRYKTDVNMLVCILINWMMTCKLWQNSNHSIEVMEKSFDV